MFVDNGLSQPVDQNVLEAGGEKGDRIEGPPEPAKCAILKSAWNS